MFCGRIIGYRDVSKWEILNLVAYDWQIEGLSLVSLRSAVCIWPPAVHEARNLSMASLKVWLSVKLDFDGPIYTYIWREICIREQTPSM
jgi:hypothetical protein